MWDKRKTNHKFLPPLGIKLESEQKGDNKKSQGGNEGEDRALHSWRSNKRRDQWDKEGAKTETEKMPLFLVRTLLFQQNTERREWGI